MTIDIAAVKHYLHTLQDHICHALEQEEMGKTFQEDLWQHKTGGGGRTRVLEGGTVIEKGGVNFSHVRGSKLPASASANRPEIADQPFEAMGISLVIHPRNP
jgi:coproporphyrinogen III oxidase